MQEGPCCSYERICSSMKPWRAIVLLIALTAAAVTRCNAGVDL